MREPEKQKMEKEGQKDVLPESKIEGDESEVLRENEEREEKEHEDKESSEKERTEEPSRSFPKR